jgi:hypothetical protein
VKGITQRILTMAHEVIDLVQDERPVVPPNRPAWTNQRRVGRVRHREEDYSTMTTATGETLRVRNRRKKRKVNKKPLPSARMPAFSTGGPSSSQGFAVPGLSKAIYGSAEKVISGPMPSVLSPPGTAAARNRFFAFPPSFAQPDARRRAILEKRQMEKAARIRRINRQKALRDRLNNLSQTLTALRDTTAEMAKGAIVVNLVDGDDSTDQRVGQSAHIGQFVGNRSPPVVMDLSGAIDLSGNAPPVQAQQLAPRERVTPMLEILKIFPNVKEDWVKQKLQERCKNSKTCQNCYKQLLSYMAENEFPAVSEEAPAADKESKSEGDILDQLQKDFVISTNSSSAYHESAMHQLCAYDFPFLKQSAITSGWHQAGRPSYVRTKKYLNGISFEDMKKRQMLLKQPRSTGRYSTSRRLPVHPGVRAEMEWEREQELKTLSPIDRILKEAADAKNGTNYTTVECLVCCEDVVKPATVTCTTGKHHFCGNCLRRYVQEEVFGKQRAVLKCMDMYGTCTGTYSPAELRRALPPRIFQKYEQTVARAAVSKAKIDGLVQCPFCDAAAIVPHGNNIFDCPNSKCQIKSCIKCKKRSHIPFKCEEAEEKNEVSIRQRIEEKMTEAKIRTCPGCKKVRFFKTEGCNKMTCSECGAYSCYVCRKYIPKEVKYKHFCQKPHCTHKKRDKCTGCPLYSNAKEDDARAVKEAGLTAREQAVFELKKFGKSGEKAQILVANMTDGLNIPGAASGSRQPKALVRGRA